MNTSPVRVSANSSIQRARARAAGVSGKSPGVPWRSSRDSAITVLSARVLIVDQDGNPPQRAEAAEFIIALERNDRVDAIGCPLEVAHRHHLAHIGRHWAADDRR